MHIHLLEILFGGLAVLRSAESSQPLISNECLHLVLVDTHDYNIDSEIKFKAINKQWIVNISLDHHSILIFCAVRKLIQGMEERNIVSLLPGQRFGDVGNIWVLLLILLESVLVQWQREGRWNKVETMGVEFTSYGHHCLKGVLVSEFLNAGIPIDDSILLLREYIKSV